jgi:hypothetical protein
MTTAQLHVQLVLDAETSAAMEELREMRPLLQHVPQSIRDELNALCSSLLEQGLHSERRPAAGAADCVGRIEFGLRGIGELIAAARRAVRGQIEFDQGDPHA